MHDADNRYRLAWFFGISLALHAIFLSLGIHKKISPTWGPLEVVLGDVPGPKALKGRKDLEKKKASNKGAVTASNGIRQRKPTPSRNISKRSGKTKNRKGKIIKRPLLASTSRKKKVLHHATPAREPLEKTAATPNSPIRQENGTSGQNPALLEGRSNGQGGSETASVHESASNKKGAARLGNRELNHYLGLVRAIIERHKYYPYNARLFGRQGRVEISFVIDRNGAIKGIRILRPCAFKDLNLAAIKTLKRVSPLPAPPKSSK
ncbi:MAG: energy transducer TonB, partial [Thermodesulfobacteria bacterium]|nr:energy transducer TonB [Thermodesulfobacteriota bacterium]